MSASSESPCSQTPNMQIESNPGEQDRCQMCCSQQIDALLQRGGRHQPRWQAVCPALCPCLCDVGLPASEQLPALGQQLYAPELLISAAVPKQAFQ